RHVGSTANNPEPTRVAVQISGSSYDIFVARGLLQRVGELLRSLSASTKVALLTDAHVAPLHAETVAESLRAAGFSPIIATIPAGESHKTLSDLAGVYDTFLAARIERSTPVIGLGGGVIGDMAGFIAATILRGVPLVQIPTSLLAMV